MVWSKSWKHQKSNLQNKNMDILQPKQFNLCKFDNIHNSIMNTFQSCTNLIKICITSNMGKKQGRPIISSRLQSKTTLFWTSLFFVESKCIFTMRDLYFDIICFKGFSILIQCFFTFLNNFWPLVAKAFASLEKSRLFLGLWTKNAQCSQQCLNIIWDIIDNLDKTMINTLIWCTTQCTMIR